MAKQIFVDDAATILALPVLAADLTITVADGSAFPSPTGGDWFEVTLFLGDFSADEIVHCTSRTGDVFTVLRGQNGTTAQDWAANTNAHATLTAGGVGQIMVQSRDLTTSLLTTNFIPRKAADGTLVNSGISDDGTTVGMARALTVDNTITAGSGLLRAIPTVATNTANVGFTNGGGSLWVGLDSSTGGNFGGGAYGAVIYSSGSVPLTVFTAGVARVQVTASGRLSVLGTEAATSTTTGSAVFSGGVGVAGALYAGGSLVALEHHANGAAGTTRVLKYTTNGSLRWALSAEATAESGSNAGSNFQINSYSDAGAFIDTPISIIRAANGALTVTRPTVFTSSSITSVTVNSTASAGHYLTWRNSGADIGYLGSGANTLPGAALGDYCVHAATTLRLGAANTIRATITSSGAIFGVNTEVSKANPIYYLTGTKAGGNQWIMQTVDADGRYRIYDNTSGNEAFSIAQGASGNVTISRPFRVTNTTASTSTTTGAMVVSGGVGVAGNVYSGGDIVLAGSVIKRGVYSGSQAALFQFSCGVDGVDPRLYMFGSAHADQAHISSIDSNIFRHRTTNGSSTIFESSASGFSVTSGRLTVISTEASTSSATGCGVFNGGVGIAGALYVGGGLNTESGRVKKWVTVSSATTLDASHHLVFCNGTFAITLPSAASHSGREYVITNIGTGVVTVSSITLNPGDSVTLFSRDSIWTVVG